VHVEQGNYDRAKTRLTESLTLFRDLRDRWAVSVGLEAVGVLATAQGQRAADPRPGGVHAARIFGAVEALRETLDAPLFPSYCGHYQRGVAAARAQLDAATFAAAWAAGRAMSLEQAIAYALEEAP
jgi:hypothetical protein